MRIVLLLLCSVTLSSCSLFGDGCPPATFGQECEVLGDWRLQTIGGERATGRLELSTIGDAYLALPSGIPGCGDLRGASRWSIREDDGVLSMTFWNAIAECDDDQEISLSVNLYGSYTLDGDRLTTSWRPEARRSGSGSGEVAIPSLGDLSFLVFAR